MMFFRNRKNKKRFTELLEELVCRKACDLQNALFLLSKNKKNKAVALAAQNLNDSLKAGSTFSLALKNCRFIEFDSLYISFVSFAERCGGLENTLLFLKNKCIREEENSSRVLEASIYPIFVVIISMVAAAGLLLYSNTFLNLQDFGLAPTSELYSSFYLGFCFLILFCIGAFFLLRKMLGTNKLYEAFLAAGFLIKGGESLSNAVKDAVNILGYDSKEGQLFAQAGKKLSYGVGLKNAFELDSWNSSLRDELEEAFFYAENSGGENVVFEKIALWLNSKDEKRRAICFKLLEPVFICGTGVFLLVFLMNLVLPLFTQNTMIL